MTALFPILIMLESLAASLMYFGAGNWRLGGYWFSAAAITFFVTV